MLALNDLLDSLSERTKDKLARQPEVVAKDGSFDVDQLPINAAKWHRLSDVVAVVFDLKSSTGLEKGRTPASTASIYDASVGGAVKALEQLGVDFVDIQGDGGFGLFWGEKRYERALCSAITIRTFSDDFTKQLEDKWSDAPSTGFKLGVAASPILAKRVGLARHLEFQEPVWAGRAVNYATKAAQQASPELIYITGGVWDHIEANEYLVFSCGCVGGEPGGSPVLLWESITLDHIPDAEKHGMALESRWCRIHGEAFLNAVLAGQTSRSDVSVENRESRNRASLATTQMVEAQKARSIERKSSHDVAAASFHGASR